MSSLNYPSRNGLAVVRINELSFIGPRTSPDISNSYKCPVDHGRYVLSRTRGDISLTVTVEFIDLACVSGV